MTDKQKETLRNLCRQGCTDSDIQDFCEEQGISRKEAFHQVSEWTAPDCCRRCIHIDMYPNMPPCPSCSRSKKDLYTKK